MMRRPITAHDLVDELVGIIPLTVPLQIRLSVLFVRRVPFSTPRLARVSGQLVINHTIDQQVMFEVFPRVSYCTSGYRACPAVAHAPMREVHPWR